MKSKPVAGHTAGVMFASAAYLAWAIVGKLATGHAGLFFLDPDLMGQQYEAVIAACVAFVTLTPGSRVNPTPSTPRLPDR